jgi:hypothetical protein
MPGLTPEERLERLERAVAQLGLASFELATANQLHAELDRPRHPDLLEIVTEYRDEYEQEAPTHPTRPTFPRSSPRTWSK